GIADDEPALFAEPRLGGGNRPLDPRRFERSSMTETHIAQKLRNRLEDAADFARMLAGLDDRRQDLQCRNEPIASCRVITEDDVAGLFAAEIAAEAAHLLDDIAVADRGAVEPDPLLRKTAIGKTSAPNSQNTVGATLYAAPWAQSTTTRSPSSRSPFGKLCLTNSI